MAIAITATPNNSTGTVALSVTGATGNLALLKRTDANGTNVDVRRTTGLAFSGGNLTLTDYEASLTGTLSYIVTTSTPVTGTTTASFSGVTKPILTNVLTPTGYRLLDAVLEYSVERESHSTVHYIINRADPLVALGASSTRSGTFDIFCSSYETALATEAMVKGDKIAQIRFPEYSGMDMYFLPLSVSTEVLENQRGFLYWIVRVEFQEVRSPSGVMTV